MAESDKNEPLLTHFEEEELAAREAGAKAAGSVLGAMAKRLEAAGRINGPGEREAKIHFARQRDAAAAAQLAATRAAIVDALHRLPLLPNVEADGQLSTAADALTLMVAPAADRQRPHAFTQGTEATRGRELAVVRKQAKALADTLDGLHGPAIDALGRRCGTLDLLKFANDLRSLSAAAEFTPLPTLEASGRGAPPKLRANGVNKVAAVHYQILTGRKPAFTRSKNTGPNKASGHLLGLLQVLYGLARINASPESQARSVRKGKKSAKDAD